MKLDLMEQLPRSQRDAVESAGYRVLRWLAAREVLQTRVSKGRVTGVLGEFLTHWLALVPVPSAGDKLWLSFVTTQDQAALKLADGSASLAASPLEHALLHLPALRSFWSQELRRQHFEALRSLVPQTWLLDAAAVPPGAVIQGLNLTSWEQNHQLGGRAWEMKDRRGQLREDWRLALAGRDSTGGFRTPSGARFSAWYHRNDQAQVVLRSIEAAP